MKISVRVSTNSKAAKVEKTADNEYRVRVRAKPVEGKANEAVRQALAEHFGVPRSKVALKSGQTSRQKVFEVGQ